MVSSYSVLEPFAANLKFLSAEYFGFLHEMIYNYTRNWDVHEGEWNYQALAGFRSKRLRFLFYFSQCAAMLHEIMYTFRARPIL